MFAKLAAFRDRHIETIGVLLTVIGVIKVIGSLSGIWILTFAGHASGISPTPNPYSWVTTPYYGNPDYGFMIGCESQNGDVKWVKWEHELRGRIPGPHRRVVSYISYFQILRYPKTPNDYRRREALSRYYFCNNGPLAKAAGCDANLESVMFKHLYPDNPQGINHLRFQCTR